jgi:hypothetical protein
LTFGLAVIAVAWAEGTRPDLEIVGSSSAEELSPVAGPVVGPSGASPWAFAV